MSDYTTIWWLVARNVAVASDVMLDKDVTIVVDSTGIKVSSRGEWICKKWKVKSGFIKVHIAVDVETKRILAIEVTREDVGDGSMFGRLVRGASNVADLRRVVANGAYDSKSNFRLADAMSIEPVIRVRKSASLKAGGCMPRSCCCRAVRQ